MKVGDLVRFKSMASNPQSPDQLNPLMGVVPDPEQSLLEYQARQIQAQIDHAVLDRLVYGGPSPPFSGELGIIIGLLDDSTSRVHWFEKSLNARAPNLCLELVESEE